AYLRKKATPKRSVMIPATFSQRMPMTSSMPGPMGLGGNAAPAGGSGPGRPPAAAGTPAPGGGGSNAPFGISPVARTGGTAAAPGAGGGGVGAAASGSSCTGRDRAMLRLT